ncbi:MAG: glycerophosphodiester phosphodiesterase [Chloroflexota bacterium]
MLPPAPTVFAHRGASLHAPENTLAAFTLAVQHGADAIELDAKLSADGQVVVIHDQTVNRTTGSHGKVGEMTLAALKRLDAGSCFDAAYRGEPIPTLDEVFEVIGKQTFTNVELTNYASPRDDLPDRVAELVRCHDLAGRVMFSSFNPRALQRAHALLPAVPLGLLALPGPKGWPMRAWPGRLLVPYQALHPEKTDTHGRLVAGLHQLGRRVHVWTVNDETEMRRLFSLGVDGIFTDDPRLAKQVLRSLPAL